MIGAYVLGIGIVLFLVGGGLTLLLFAPSIQALVLRYSPADWYEPMWRGIAAQWRRPAFVLGLRIGGVLMIGMGIVFAIAVARGPVR